MENIKFNNQNIIRVEVIPIPDDINIDGILPNKCTNNSKLIAENNVKVTYIEGVVIIYINESNFYAELHAWNKIDDTHFDATLETMDELCRLKKREDLILKREYFPFIEVDSSKLEMSDNGEDIVKFSESSKEFMLAMQKKFPKK